MAFLDNSGDIILDAVLTDTGRLRMAQGDGSFKISKFALGDDEINYNLYNKDHLSGSAYYDLEIMQTPVLEAFTNNTSNLKTKLVTMSRTNVLYMPIMKLNLNNLGNTAAAQKQALPSKFFARNGSTDNTANGGSTLIGETNAANVSKGKYYIAVDAPTFFAFNTYRVNNNATPTDSKQFTPGNVTQGLIQGHAATTGVPYGGSLIRVDHGLNTSEVAPAVSLDNDLMETAFIVELDYRLGRVKLAASDSVAPVNFIDDDNIATYYLTSKGTAASFVNPYGETNSPKNTNSQGLSLQELVNDQNPQVFAGPRGNTLQFRIHASQELRQSTYLFTQMGATSNADSEGNIGGFATTDGMTDGKNIYYIDSTVRVTGANTGYRLDIPVRFIKLAD